MTNKPRMCGKQSFGLAGRIGIDGFVSGHNDLLTQIRGFFGASASTHLTRAVALKTCVSDAETNVVAAIIGHGSPGAVGTGCGFIGGRGRIALPCTETPSQTLCLNNHSDWERQFLNNTRAAEILIVACDAGAELGGVDFLSELATLSGIPCSAPTGWVVFNPGTGLFSFIEAQACWQRVDPGCERPQPIPLPRKPTPLDLNLLRLDVDGNLTPVWVEDVSSVSVFAPGSENAFHYLAEGDARWALRQAALDSPIGTGLPLAFLTGRLEIEFKEGSPVARREFDLFNDRMLMDTESKHLYPIEVLALLGQ